MITPGSDGRLSRSARMRERIRSLSLHQLRASIVLAIAIGAMTGGAVALLHFTIYEWVWAPLSVRSDWWIAVLPIVGLLLATAIVSVTADRSSETTEEYIRAYHGDARVRLRSAPWKLLAAFSTIGLGGSLGLEGPSIYVGSVIGDLGERIFGWRLDQRDTNVMLVAGAAAGISAIFKAPVTGIVFALEVPYRDDLARHALIPAMFASAASYLVFVATAGTAPFFPIQAAPLRYADLLGSLLVGLGCGLAARTFVGVYRAVRAAFERLPRWVRPIPAGLILAGVGAVSLGVFHLPLALGPGNQGILRAARGQLGPGLLLALLALKVVSTSATGAGNGVGGLFFPSVMMGAAAGGAIGRLVPGPTTLFPIVGIAAFLGGVYKVPLAGVAFVAETTGAPGYIIPGLLGAALGYLASGKLSLSKRQRFRRSSELESRPR